MVLQVGQVQGTRGCLLGQLAVFCWSGRIVSSSGYCHVLHSIVACAVDVGGELYQLKALEKSSRITSTGNELTDSRRVRGAEQDLQRS